MTYLLDKSAWALGAHNDVVRARLAQLIRRGRLGVCTMTALEALYSARNRDDYRVTLDQLRRLPWHELADARSAVALQHRLAERGWHRTSLPDVTITAVAAEHGLTVLHYDSDYERLAEVAGIDHEWVIERGTGRPPA